MSKVSEGLYFIRTAPYRFIRAMAVYITNMGLLVNGILSIIVFFVVAYGYFFLEDFIVITFPKFHSVPSFLGMVGLMIFVTLWVPYRYFFIGKKLIAKDKPAMKDTKKPTSVDEDIWSSVIEFHFMLPSTFGSNIGLYLFYFYMRELEGMNAKEAVEMSQKLMGGGAKSMKSFQGHTARNQDLIVSLIFVNFLAVVFLGFVAAAWVSDINKNSFFLVSLLAFFFLVDNSFVYTYLAYKDIRSKVLSS